VSYLTVHAELMDFTETKLKVQYAIPKKFTLKNTGVLITMLINMFN